MRTIHEIVDFISKADEVILAHEAGAISEEEAISQLDYIITELRKERGLFFTWKK